MHAALVQLDIAWEDKPANFDRVHKLLSTHRPAAGSLVVLPEMFATGFSCDLKSTLQADPPETDAFLSGLARELNACVVGGAVTTGPDGRPYNESVAFAPDGLRKRFAKIHPFRRENTVHAPGGEVVTFSWGGFEIAPLVCYDLRFPESFRTAARLGATLMVVIANWPAARIEHWVTLLRARAIENQAYVIGVNRSGTDPEFSYPGRSLVIDPHGSVLIDAEDGEKVVTAELDPSVVSSWREDFPALRDARW